MHAYLFRAAAGLSVAATAIYCPAPAQAQSQLRNFSVSTQHASTGVREFAKQAGIQVIVSGRDVENRMVNAVTGRLDVREALDQLLAGTGLKVRSFDGKTAVLGNDDRATTAEVETDTITVTASHVITNAFDSPQPIRSVGAEELQQRALNNVADVVNFLPSFTSGISSAANTGTTGSGYTGVNALNIHGLGINRTLVLLDSMRMPAATLAGAAVDINSIPNSLIQRVDVVTGGVSATWGSDAVGGVVNFVLDKNFTGLKGSLQGGVTTYGDDASYNASLAGGTPFADGRGHVMASVEAAGNQGIKGMPRAFYAGRKQINNPAYTATNGQPRYLIYDNVGFSQLAPGGIVASGPLAGLYFGQGGAPAQLDTGTLVSTPFIVGGDWAYTDAWNTTTQSMLPQGERYNVFARASYELTDTVKIYGQFLFSKSDVNSIAVPNFYLGNLTIKRDNAFLPASVAASMTAHDLNALAIGTTNADWGPSLYTSTHDLYRYVLGVSGTVGLFGKDWTWDVFGYRNVSKIYQGYRVINSAKFAEAIDAVVGPTGAIVCRSTLISPGNGCVPYNVLGVGVVSDAARNYVSGYDWVDETITQDVVSASVRGEAFSTWAGPVTMAVGFEHRREKANGEADPIGLVNGYRFGNYKPEIGSYHVSEGFVEAVIPMLRNQLVKSFDINLGFRGTDYSAAGYVSTWKAGLVFAPIDDIRIRATRSRDIRAATLAEMFQAGSAGGFVIADPANNNLPTSYLQLQRGNPAVRPEKSDTMVVGVIVQPRFLPGFSMSVDYWDYRIKGAIAATSAANTLNQCYFYNNANLCSNIVRDASGTLQSIYLQPTNLGKQTSTGLDIEASYRFALADATMTLRGLATRNLKSVFDDGIVGPGGNAIDSQALPQWRYMVTAAYDRGPLNLSLAARGLSFAENKAVIYCTSDCPASGAISTVGNMTGDKIKPARVFLDMSVSYDIKNGAEGFLAVRNLLNTNPPLLPEGPGFSTAMFDYERSYYDVAGRIFTVGMRFKY